MDEENKPSYEELLGEFRDLEKLATALFKKYEESVSKCSKLEERVKKLEEKDGTRG